jgi:hypothetical protein
MTGKMTIYLKVKGKTHVFRLPPETKLQTVIDTYQTELNIDAKDRERMHVVLPVSLNQSIGDISVKDESEMIILLGNEILRDDIEYKGLQP